MKPCAFCTALVYHAVYEQIPSPLENRIHNVDPDTFYKQMKWLKANYDIVPLADNPFDSSSGFVSLTFDDGNSSVFSQAIPILDSMSIPATVFPIGCTFSGNQFWRDKIRIIIHLGLERELILRLEEHHGVDTTPFRRNLLSATKESVLCDAIFDRASSEVLSHVTDRQAKPGWHSPEALRRTPSALLKFGNHTYFHYRQSSLSPEAQKLEIEEGESAVRREYGTCEKTLAIPFGRIRDLGSRTLRICRELGYQTVLFCESNWEASAEWPQDSAPDGLRFANRVKAPGTVPEFQRLFNRTKGTRLKGVMTREALV
jgi:peptidoglycan/xylan/chitin deacetylase (PgdA/CDA1 family)